jgi:hypothetical protein
MIYYTIDENHQIHPEPDSMKWNLWFQKSNHLRIVKKTQIGSMTVSTVFLGMDHNFREQLSGINTGASRDQFGTIASSPPIRVSTSLRPLRYSTLLSSDLLSARTFPCSPGDVILFRFYRGTDCFPSNRISHFQRSIFRMPHRERERKPKGLLILDSALKNGVCG